MSETLRVVIDARLSSGRSGGIEQIVIGLASGLAEVAEAGDEYVFVVHDDSWLRPFLRGPMRVVQVPAGSSAKIRGAARRIPGLARLWRALRRRRAPAVVQVPQSPGVAESIGADVVHFPTSIGYATSVPSIFHPWDLQHIHYPEFFTRNEWVTRDHLYRELCTRAEIVSVATEWVKTDLVEQFGIDAAKIEVVPVAPVVTAYAVPTAEDLERVRRERALPPQFAYFPAYTWPHKNHLGVIRAVALLRDRGHDMHVVFSGGETAFAPRLHAEVRRLGVGNLVRFLGFVSPLEVQCIYRLATFLVFPSKFEGWGMPVPEAYHSGLPVAASSVPSVAEVTSGAALLFDPDDVEAIADAMLRLQSDPALRQELIQRGREIDGRLSWAATARRFRELYLRVARDSRRV